MRLGRTMRMGVSGGRLLLCLSDSHEIKNFGSLLIFVYSFSAARKRMDIRGSKGIFPRFWSLRKKKYIGICNQHIYKNKLELKIMRKSNTNYLGMRIHMYKNVKYICLCVGFIAPTLLSMQKMYYNI